jgi:hypothetical protein
MMPADLDSRPDSAPASDRDIAAAAIPPLTKTRYDPLFFTVIVLLLADIGFGLGLAVFADRILKFPPMAAAGVGLAVLGLAILAYFLLFGDGRSLTQRAAKSGKAKSGS